MNLNNLSNSKKLNGLQHLINAGSGKANGREPKTGLGPSFQL
jgi:hypothetical protein